MDNKELISRLISFDDGEDTSTGYVNVGAGLNQKEFPFSDMEDFYEFFREEYDEVDGILHRTGALGNDEHIVSDFMYYDDDGSMLLSVFPFSDDYFTDAETAVKTLYDNMVEILKDPTTFYLENKDRLVDNYESAWKTDTEWMKRKVIIPATYVRDIMYNVMEYCRGRKPSYEGDWSWIGKN